MEEKIKLKYKTAKNIANFIKDAVLTEISIGCSSSQVIKIEKQDGNYYLKMASLGELTNEYQKLNWLSGKVKVPEIILYETYKQTEYLITKAVAGEMVCSDFYLESDNWKLGIPIIIEAFKELFDVDIKDCPFNVSLDYKLLLVKKNIDNKLLDLNNINVDVLKQFKTPENIYQYLVDNRFEEDLCFTHGDISLPNIFVHNNHFSGFVDVGECGIADKWFDLAIATRTIRRNYGEEAVNTFFEQLNIKKDDFKINYYLLMMELYL